MAEARWRHREKLLNSRERVPAGHAKHLLKHQSHEKLSSSPAMEKLPADFGHISPAGGSARLLSCGHTNLGFMWRCVQPLRQALFCHLSMQPCSDLGSWMAPSPTLLPRGDGALFPLPLSFICGFQGTWKHMTPGVDLLCVCHPGQVT